jgi:hypothetical protein
MSELNQNWHVNYHKRNHNGITQLVTGPVGLVQLFFIAIWGKQNQLTLIEIVPFKRIMTGFDRDNICRPIHFANLKSNRAAFMIRIQLIKQSCQLKIWDNPIKIRANRTVGV